MAFFKLRLPGRLGSNSPSADALSNTPAESVEVIRKRARHRLMGSVILVLGAVVGLPLLFDSQPRPVAIDTPIVIPDRNQVAPLASPSAVVKPAAPSKEVVVEAADSAPVTTGKSAVANVAALDPHEEVVSKDTKNSAKSEAKTETKPDVKSEVKSESKPESKTETKTETKPTTKAETKSENKTESKAVTKTDSKEVAKDSAKAKALLDGKEVPKSGDAVVRSVVQVGAFAEMAKVKEARAKLESAGFKTYTQDVETKDGKRTRVRVGPFASKEEADKAAEKIRKLNLQATVLKL
ncbi:SPOR domain-containing protein [Limnohabitans sp. Rim11]|uniref:SPOR domain-containing protein n=1 Tax=Limnohabitans sp. Rim11 TaxID=1100719 RepID=UPI000AA9AC9A|nr:SPOR domain-containing protein [Limnohabitans sp. Rim11]